MKTTISKLKYVLFLFVIIGFVSCEGPIGPSGLDGTDGTNGTAGIDGNANVQAYVYNNPVWGNDWWMDITMTDILTEDVIQNDVILGYVTPVGNPLVNPIPGKVFGKDIYVTLFGSTFIYRISSYETDGTPTPNADLVDYDWVRIIIIESTNTTTYDGNGGKSLNPKQAIYDELEEAGVDINNYYEVMDYYGLDY